MMLKQLYKKLSEKRLQTTLAVDDNSHIVSIFDDRELIDVVFENGRDVELFYLDKRDYDSQRCSNNPLIQNRNKALGVLHGLLVMACFGFSAVLFFKLCGLEDPLVLDDSPKAANSGRILFYKKEGQVYSDLEHAGRSQAPFADRGDRVNSFAQVAPLR